MPETWREVLAGTWEACSKARAAAGDTIGAARALRNAGRLRVADRIARRLGYDEDTFDPDVVA